MKPETEKLLARGANRERYEEILAEIRAEPAHPGDIDPEPQRWPLPHDWADPEDKW